MDRVLAWFSCGAASAVTAKLAIDRWGDAVVPVYCDVSASESPDNKRFMREVAHWIKRPILTIRNSDYASIDEVFERTRYMAGIKGARCTVEMKKVPRFEFQRPDDIHCFGFTVDEKARIDGFVKNNPELSLAWPLVDAGYTKKDCFEVLHRAGIELPVMYRQGYKNNNCIGCVKATSAKYWNMIRRDYPEVFERRARQSREIGVRLTRVKGKRAFLDELPEEYHDAAELENISCGPECATG